MELRQLRYFVAVADEGQFVRAAGRLRMAQSALSQQVLALERELGVDLLVRDRRGCTLTPAGELLRGRAGSILAAVDDATSELRLLAGAVTGQLRVGAGAPASPTRLLDAIGRFRAAHPGVEVSVADAPTRALLERLVDGDLDVAIVSRAVEDLPAGVGGVLLRRERFVVLLPAGHRLARRRRLRLRELADVPLVGLTPGSGIRELTDAALAGAGREAGAPAAETLDPAMLVDLVAHGLGAAVVPASFAGLAGPGVRCAAISGPAPVRPLTLAWPVARRRGPAIAAFLDLALPLLRA